MPQDPNQMYRWRKLTPEQRIELLQTRIRYRRPVHSPAACYEHCSIIGESSERMRRFESDLVDLLEKQSTKVFTWSILPNHYHALVDCADIKAMLSWIGRLHGRSSFYWNGEDNLRGRQVWCNAAETMMKSEGHFYASLNYVHHNAVHHGYVSKWTDWPFCSATQYLETVGRQRALQIWNSYPLYDFGKDWDPPNL
jgi:putative transposase